MHEFKPITKRKKIRIGRGYGTRRGGHTVGRGTKGQKSRSGYKFPGRMFEGGQNYLSKRVPKLRGFSRKFITRKGKSHAINVSDLDALPSGTTVTPAVLGKILAVPKSKNVTFKILGWGDIKSKINIEGVRVSQSAKEKIEKAGGSVK